MSFGLHPHEVSRVMGNKLASGVLEAITIDLRKQKKTPIYKKSVTLNSIPNFCFCIPMAPLQLQKINK